MPYTKGILQFLALDVSPGEYGKIPVFIPSLRHLFPDIVGYE